MKNHKHCYVPLLRVLRRMGGIAQKREAIAAVGRELNMSETETESIKVLVAWSRTYLGYEGYIKPVVESGRGNWALSEKGWDADLDSLDVDGIYSRGLGREVKSIDSPAEAAEESPPEYSLRDELLAKLRRVSPPAFENICCCLLGSLGFENVLPTPQTLGEEGFDGIGFAPNPLVKTKYLFEFKRYGKGNSVPRQAIQKFAGILANPSRGANQGIILATSDFSAPAKQEAEQHANIGLVGGDELAGLFEKSKVGLKEVPVIDDEFFARFDAASAQERN